MLSSVKNIIFYIPSRMKMLFKKYGWRAAVGIFIYYLVRDVTLYIIIPYFISFLNYRV